MESSESSAPTVPPSLRALLHQIVDYAGLFPPADLSLRRSLQNYADYREDREAWMLSRFVLPVRRLPDLSPFHRSFSTGNPYRFSVLGTGGEAPDSFLNALERDLEVIDAFDDEYGGRAEVDAMEVPLPSSLLGSSQSDLQSFFERVDQRLVADGTAQLDFFFEVATDADPIDGLRPLCAAVADHNSRQAVPARSTVGLKIRCGGSQPSDIPSVGQVASLIVACRDAGISFKATAGLHHPFRHYDDGFDTEMHGFVNIFGAAALAAEHSLDADDLVPILRDEDATNFRFLKERFAWRNAAVSLDGIEHAREALALSFGSCSFEEPIDHLRDLDLL
jgi:hypothetical protein